MNKRMFSFSLSRRIFFPSIRTTARSLRVSVTNVMIVNTCSYNSRRVLVKIALDWIRLFLLIVHSPDSVQWQWWLPDKRFWQLGKLITIHMFLYLLSLFLSWFTVVYFVVNFFSIYYKSSYAIGVILFRAALLFCVRSVYYTNTV